MRALVAQLAMVRVTCVCTHPGPGHGFFCPKMRVLRVMAHLEKAGGKVGSVGMHDRMVKRGFPEYGLWSWDGERWRVKFSGTEAPE